MSWKDSNFIVHFCQGTLKFKPRQSKFEVSEKGFEPTFSMKHFPVHHDTLLRRITGISPNRSPSRDFRTQHPGNVAVKDRSLTLRSAYRLCENMLVVDFPQSIMGSVGPFVENEVKPVDTACV